MIRKFFFLLLFPVLLSAQVKVDALGTLPRASATQYQFQITVDSLNIYYTSAFTFGGYDKESYSTYPLTYQKIVSSAGTPKVTIYVEGSAGLGWTTVDTLVTADSVKTLAGGTIDLNNKHYPLYRLKVFGATGNRRDVVYKLVLYNPWEMVK